MATKRTITCRGCGKPAEVGTHRLREGSPNYMVGWCCSNRIRKPRRSKGDPNRKFDRAPRPKDDTATDEYLASVERFHDWCDKQELNFREQQAMALERHMNSGGKRGKDARAS